MRPEGVAAAKRELRRAASARRRLSTARHKEDAEDAWSDFLAYTGKVYSKLRAACYGHPLDYGWFGKKVDERNRNPLMHYLHKARDSETHRVEEITAWDAPEFHTNLEWHGKVRVRLEERLSLLPVLDKQGAICAPPDQGEPGGVSAIAIANLAHRYLERLLDEAEKRLSR